MKIEKGSPEFQMFQEFWGLRQKYHDSDNTDEFWDGFIKEVSLFIDKYKHEDFGVFVSEIGSAMLDDVERRYKKNGNTHNE